MSYNDDFPTKREGFRFFGWTISATIGAVIVGFVAIVLVGALMWVWAPWQGKIQERNQTVGNGTYRIAAYEQFFNDCGSIQALEVQIDNAAAASSVPEQATNLLALENQHASLATQYNADSAKADTRAHFKDSRLPYTINPVYAPGQEHVVCALS